MKYITRLFPLGIRVQLTLWYSLVFVALIVMAGILVYTRLQNLLAASLDTELQVQAQQIANDILRENGTIKITDATAELPGFDAADRVVHVSPADVNLGVLVRVLDLQGRSYRATPAFSLLLVPNESVTAPLHGRPWQGTIVTRDGQAVRLYSRALVQDGVMFGVIQVGTSLAQLETALREVIETFLLIAPGILIVGALISYWLAGRAFAPIDRLIQAARAIQAGNLQQRVPVPRARDEVRRLAATLNEMIERLEQVFLRQRRFVADASHELRTPVAVIRSKADMALLSVYSPDDYLRLFSSISTEAQRLSHLLADLLVLARMDERQMHLDKESVRLDQLVQAVAAEAQPLADQHQVTLQVQANTPVTILGDEARMIQVVMNLLENAMSYTNPGGQVTLCVQQDGKQAKLTVEDTGIGIAKEHLPHLIERFYRVDLARAQTDRSHSGLGLSIVDGIVKAHDGILQIESQPGQGSTFHIILPSSDIKEPLSLSSEIPNGSR